MGGADQDLEPPERLADQVDRLHRPPPRCAARSPELPRPGRHGDRDGCMHGPIATPSDASHLQTDGGSPAPL
jgi:hypothetical protein